MANTSSSAKSPVKRIAWLAIARVRRLIRFGALIASEMILRCPSKSASGVAGSKRAAADQVMVMSLDLIFGQLQDWTTWPAVPDRPLQPATPDDLRPAELIPVPIESLRPWEAAADGDSGG